MKFGLIGAGMIGRIRTLALRQTRGCILTAVADKDEQRAKNLAADCDARVFNDYRRMLDMPDLEAVIVSTPPQFHEEIVISSLEAGKHVICEKPLSNSVDSCLKMLKTAQKCQKLLTTGFNHRYFPAIQTIKKALDDGLIGELDHVRAFAGHTGLSEFEAPWMHNKDIMGGGTLMDNGIHTIDLVRYILGEVNDVYGFATTNVWNLDRSEDNGFVLMRSPQGKVATLHSSWSEWKGYRFYIEIYGTKGMAKAYYAPMQSMIISMDRPGGKPRKKINFYPHIILREKLKGWQSTAIETFKNELTDFITVAEKGQNGHTIADGFAGLRAVEIAQAVYQSAQTNTPIILMDPKTFRSEQKGLV